MMLRIRLKPKAQARILAGHPWVFRDSIDAHNRPGATGDLAAIFDRRKGKDSLLALGLYDADSPIAVRIIHRGRPIPIDDAFWARRLSESIAKRSTLLSPSTDACRLVNGENDGFPGLVIDRYRNTSVLKIYTAAWLPHLRAWRDTLLPQLNAATVVLRLSRNIAAPEFEDGQILAGAPISGPVTFKESGLLFEADVLRGQKTGFFLDQRENRRAVESLAAGRDVLNTFSFSGAFSLYAARGRARTLCDLDISAHALESARRNFALNPLPSISRESIQADAFEWLRDSIRTWDMIILDPPSLARREAERPLAIRAYKRLAALGAARLRPGGILVAASCSAHVAADEFFAAALRGVGRPCHELARTRHPSDHPAVFPEAHYLKCLFLRI